MRPTSIASIATLALLLGGCSIDPAVRADAASPAYQTDLAVCRAEVVPLVDRENAKTVFSWIGSPVRRPGQIKSGLRACLAGKGYEPAG